MTSLAIVHETIVYYIIKHSTHVRSSLKIYI